MIRSVASAWEYFEKWQRKGGSPLRPAGLGVMSLEDRLTPAVPIDPAPSFLPGPLAVIIAPPQLAPAIPVGQISLEARVRTDLFGVGDGQSPTTTEAQLGRTDEGDPQRPGMVRQDMEEEPPSPENGDGNPEVEPNPALMVFAVEPASESGGD